MVVTGASSGVGRAVAHAFAARGDHVVLAARSAQSLAEVAQECRQRGGTGLAVPTDVTDQAAVHALAESAVDHLGRIDVWVNAAAVWSYGRFEDTTEAVFRQVLETTFMGQVNGARAALPHFRAQGRGTLVTIASIYGLVSSPYVAPYVAAKWALVGFSEVLRQELRGEPAIAVCTVLPGTVDTPIYRHAANTVGRELRPLPPVVSPERVAAAVVRLADRPRSRTVVGRTQHAGVWLHRLAPGLYDRVVGPAVRLLTLRRRRVEPHDGTVFHPDTPSNAVRDGWRAHDGRLLGAAGAAVGGAVWVTALVRRGAGLRGR